jgi:tetratricopeptide (TPR) repeat protein
MTSLRKTVSGLILAVLIAAAPAIAGKGKKEKPSTDAQIVANTAIAQLAGLQTKAARKTLESSKEKYGTSPEFKTAWALLEAQEAGESGKGYAASGFAEISQMAKADKVDPVASYWEGELYYLQGKNKEALAAWQTASARAAQIVDKTPTDATAQYYLGAALVRQKKYDPALKALRLAVRGGFDEAMVNLQIGFIYLYQEKWADAKSAFDVGLSVNPRFAPLYFWRAMAWDKLGRKDNLMIDLDQYLKLAPNGPEAGKARAILKSTGG